MKLAIASVEKWAHASRIFDSASVFRTHPHKGMRKKNRDVVAPA